MVLGKTTETVTRNVDTSAFGAARSLAFDLFELLVTVDKNGKDKHDAATNFANGLCAFVDEAVKELRGE